MAPVAVKRLDMLGAEFAARAGGRREVELPMRFVCTLFLLSALSAPALAAPPPEAIRAMIETALATENPQTIAGVIDVAKRTAPDSIAEIDAITADYYAGVEAMKVAEAKAAEEKTQAENTRWKGSIEVGGNRTTGASRVLDAYGRLSLERVGPRWSHKFTGAAAYQRTAGRTSAERTIAAYEPRVKLNPTFYSFGLAQYEHDRFLGFRNRYTAGLGFGVMAVDQPDLVITFDAGPATRITQLYEMQTESRIAARSGFTFKWLPSSRVTITQNAALYLQKGESNARSSTGLETRLFGPLKGRLSYDVQYEPDAPVGRASLDTTSRVGLAYTF